MRRAVMGLDPGTRSMGYAVLDPDADELLDAGAFRIDLDPPGRGPGWRLVTLARNLSQLFERWQLWDLALVAVEVAPGMQRGGDAALWQGAIVGTVWRACEERQPRQQYVNVPITHWKQEAGIARLPRLHPRASKEAKAKRRRENRALTEAAVLAAAGERWGAPRFPAVDAAVAAFVAAAGWRNV